MIVLEVAFYVFIATVCIQVFFYGILFNILGFQKIEKATPKNIGVSVIVCAKNEAENLKRFLPDLLSQNFPKFELVLINDNSKDETLEVMESFKERHPNIIIVNVKPNEAFWGSKKYALTLGIKAATYDFLLFTDADCKPISEDWIKEMSAHFSNTKSIVLGYGAYKKIKGSFLNKLIRYETLLTALQYFSLAKTGSPYMGVGRNLAYRKALFFQTNGFMSHMKLQSGDDDLFINQVADNTNTAIALTPNSFTESLPKTTFKQWMLQKRRHISTAKHYKFKHKLILTVFYVSQLLFWTLATILLIYLFQWKIVLGFVLLRLVLQWVTLYKNSSLLNEKDLTLLGPILEIFLIAFQFFIFIQNLISKPQHWK